MNELTPFAFLTKYPILEIAPKSNPEKIIRMEFKFKGFDINCNLNTSNIAHWKEDKEIRILTLGITFGKILGRDMTYLIPELEDFDSTFKGKFIIKFKSDQNIEKKEISLQEII